MDRQGPPNRPRYQFNRGLTRTRHEKDAMTSRCLDRKRKYNVPPGECTLQTGPMVLVSAGVRSMLGYIGTSDTSQTGPTSPCILHPAFCPRISWRRRDQIVWPQWPYQLWPLLWISHSRVTGHYVQLEPCATTWTGPQILGRIRSWSLSPSRKGLIKTSHLPLSPHGSNRL